MFSIIIPSWNNLQLLQLCVRSVRENSAYPHQIIVHVNEGSDGTLEWVRQLGLDHTFSEQNVGICYAMNEAITLSKHPYIYYLNDDMYCCPGWDTALLRRTSKLSEKFFMLSSTAIEPLATNNPSVLVHDFGHCIAEFQEKALLQEVKTIQRPDFYSGGCVPNLVARDWWLKVGGYSIEFSPGMNSDDDFAMKMWISGCRIFIGVGDSLIYHFSKQSTARHKMNNGSRQYLDKWGMTARFFRHYYLRQGQSLRNLTLSEPVLTPYMHWRLLLGHLKRRLF